MNLVTGASSGLGRFLCEQLNAIPYYRMKPETSLKQITRPLNAIIHCAFNTSRDINSTHFSSYLKDNLELTKTLLAIPHKKFIFISTSDVYPRNEKRWEEDDEYSIEKIEGLYGLTKLMAETLVKNSSPHYLILRPTALLGPYSRPNSLIKMLTGETKQLTLNQQSTFNYILHQDILEFINTALTHEVTGTFNCAAREEICLEEIAKQLPHNIHFGDYIYTTAKVCSKKARKICPVFSYSSYENIKRFCAMIGV